MKPIGTPPTEPQERAAWDIVQSTNRSPEALARLQAYYVAATGDVKTRIGWLIEGFLVDGGIEEATG